MVAGWSFRPTTNWNLEVNIDWTDWDKVDRSILNEPTGSSYYQFDWQSSFSYCFGITRYLANGFRLSSGYIYSENSGPETWLNPVAPDSDRHIVSLGIGGAVGKIQWDAAYQFAYAPDQAIKNSRFFSTPFEGEYELSTHALSFSVQCSF